jgi:hypothetical protein
MSPQKQLEDLYDDATADPVYHAKDRILNAAIQDIGTGPLSGKIIHLAQRRVHCLQYCLSGL